MELEPRDHQLFADLERAFSGTSFLMYEDAWKDFHRTGSLAVMPGDIESMRRLVRTGKVKHLGALNGRPHYVIKR